MGNGFGNLPSSGFNLYFYPEVTPSPLEEPTFDPCLGFPNGRKKREMIATEAELKSAKVPLHARDYCSHLVLKFMACRKDNFPFVVKCEHEKHAYLNCMNEDYIIRTKEYERERRLRVREQRLQKKAATAESEDE